MNKRYGRCYTRPLFKFVIMIRPKSGLQPNQGIYFSLRFMVWMHLVHVPQRVLNGTSLCLQYNRGWVQPCNQLGGSKFACLLRVLISLTCLLNPSDVNMKERLIALFKEVSLREGEILRWIDINITPE